MTEPISIADYRRLARTSGEKPIPPEVWFSRVGSIPQVEYRFDATRKWRFDYAFPDYKVAVEINGGLWLGRPCPVCKRRPLGRHNRPGEDMEKMNAAQAAGWIVLQYTYARGRHPFVDVDFRQVCECLTQRVHIYLREKEGATR